MSHDMIALTMFGSMVVLLLTGQRVFAAVGFVASVMVLMLYGTGGAEIPFSAAFKLFNWFPMLTLPMFIYTGYVLSESGIAEDLYRMLHVWFGRVGGGACNRYDRSDGHYIRNEWAFCCRHGYWCHNCPARDAASGL